MRGVALVGLLLAVLETGALVVLEKTMLAAKVTLAEGTVADDALSRLPALGSGAADSLGRHGCVGRCRKEYVGDEEMEAVERSMG